MRQAPSIEIALDTDEDSGAAAAAPPTTPPGDDELSGLVVGRRYRLLRLLGRGGMGAVYLAEHVTLAKRFAVKLLDTPAGVDGNHAIRRFVREARATCLLRHEHVVDVCDFGSSRGRVYLVMEHLEGEDLAAALRRDGPMPWPRVARILLQVCAALQVAHARQIVHRDIKPSNCFLVARGDGALHVKVLDFGVAKVLRGGLGDAALETDASICAGTPEYMAPECLGRDAIDARTDVYSVGMLGYHLLTGRLPFSRAQEGLFELVRAGVIVPPRRATPQLRIPVEAEAIVMRALRPRPADRFQSIAQLAAAISATVDPLPPAAPGIDDEARTIQFSRRPPPALVAPPAPPLSLLGWVASGVAGTLALLLALAVWTSLTAEPELSVVPDLVPAAAPAGLPAPGDASAPVRTREPIAPADDLEILILDDPDPEPEPEPDPDPATSDPPALDAPPSRLPLVAVEPPRRVPIVAAPRPRQPDNPAPLWRPAGPPADPVDLLRPIP